LNANENTLVGEEEEEMEKMSDGYTQTDNLRAAVHLVEEHMLQFQLHYDFLFVLRADHEVNAKNLPGCLLKFGKPLELAGEDFGQAIPRKYLPCYFKKVREYKWSLGPVSWCPYVCVHSTLPDCDSHQAPRSHCPVANASPNFRDGRRY
jgi:hypothetical protein